MGTRRVESNDWSFTIRYDMVETSPSGLVDISFEMCIAGEWETLDIAKIPQSSVSCSVGRLAAMLAAKRERMCLMTKVPH